MTALAVATENDVLRAALAYAERGWRVVPIRPGEKRPMIDAWQDAATTDAALIEQWWRRWPAHGVGIATGRESGIFVLDVDNNHAAGKYGDDSLADLEATYGKLPDTVEVLTGSGGRHLYFRFPANAEVTNSAGRLGPWLDVRGDGGQVVAPPTKHPNGCPYEWDASSRFDEVELADAPVWLLRLLTEAPAVEPRRERIAYAGEPRPGDRFAASVTWPDLLRADGATFLDARNDRRSGETYEVWARPGIDDHGGATLYYGGSDVLKVFTSNWPGLTEGETYTRFGYFVATRYGGDFSRAASDLAGRYSVEEVERWALIESAPLSPPEGDPGASDGLPVPVHWPTFWSTSVAADWLVEPLIPAGRHVVLYAPAKMGKSLLALEVAAAAASGRGVLGQPPQDPIEVVYFDFEMTEDDLKERLSDMGYDAASDLSHLHYFSLPALPPLDTDEGGRAVEAIVRRHGARLVVIDTMARVVQGEENSNDTYRWFDMHTSLRMKTLGVAVLRLDHAGKDTAKGQRGASEKVGYADVVWSLTVDDKTGRGTLKATHRRLGWVDEVVHFARLDDPLSHAVEVEQGATPEGWRIVELLNSLDVPWNASFRVAGAALRAAGHTADNEKVREAVKARKQHRNAPRNTESEGFGRNADEVASETTPDQAGTPDGTPRSGLLAPVRNTLQPHRGAVVRTDPSDDSLFD